MNHRFHIKLENMSRKNPTFFTIVSISYNMENNIIFHLIDNNIIDNVLDGDS